VTEGPAINIKESGDPAHIAMPHVDRVAPLLKRWLLGLSSTPAAPRLALTFRHASQTTRLETTNGLPFGFGLLTGSSREIALA
jgi:hypothetical protein